MARRGGAYKSEKRRKELKRKKKKEEKRLKKQVRHEPASEVPEEAQAAEGEPETPPEAQKE